MKEDGTETGVSGDPSGKRQVARAEMIVDERLRNAEVQPGTVSRAVRGPRDSRIDEVPFWQYRRNPWSWVMTMQALVSGLEVAIGYLLNDTALEAKRVISKSANLRREMEP